jgi:hypothetical protein
LFPVYAQTGSWTGSFFFRVAQVPVWRSDLKPCGDATLQEGSFHVRAASSVPSRPEFLKIFFEETILLIAGAGALGKTRQHLLGKVDYSSWPHW